MHEPPEELPAGRAAARERVDRGEVYREDVAQARKVGLELRFVLGDEIQRLLQYGIRSHSYLDEVKGYLPLP